MKKIILAVMMILILQIDVFAAAGLKLGKLTIDDIKKNIMTIEQLETAKILNVEIQELNDTIATIFWQTDTFSTV
ncbi:MAG TPA: hypothetical protein PLJ38_08395, partial [bacterium]|nr:hypothetical protein [bacterium]